MDSEENPKHFCKHSGRFCGNEKKRGVGRARRGSPKHAPGSVLVTASMEGYRAQGSVQKLHWEEGSGHKAAPAFPPARTLSLEAPESEHAVCVSSLGFSEAE